MADAVHADHTFFSTCGSSLSVKAAMLAVAGPGMNLPDAADPSLETIRVVARS